MSEALEIKEDTGHLLIYFWLGPLLREHSKPLQTLSDGAFIGGPFFDNGGNMVETCDLIHASQLNGLLGHPIDDAGIFVLGHRVRTGLLHLKHTLGSIGAHSCKDNPE